MPEATRKSMVTDVKLLVRTPRCCVRAVKNGKPASAQVTTLLRQVKKVQDAIAASSAAASLKAQSARFDPIRSRRSPPRSA